jgi:uncharacterized protein (DUF1800 family)
MVVSAIRASGAEVTDTYALAQRIGDLGEPLYGKQDPNGYSDTGEAWLSTSSLFGRINFAASLMSGQIAGIKVDGARLDGKDAATIARELIGAGASPQTREAIEKGLEGKEPTARFIAGLVMGSPDFQKR